MKLILVLAFFVSTTASVPHFLWRNSLLPDGRIIGGSDIPISEVPWQVSLQYYGSHICGGSIISKDWIVTAAHCTDGLPTSLLSIQAGTSTLGSGGQVLNIARIYQHPTYDPRTIDYDISVLHLASSLQLNENVAPVKLPSSSDNWDPGTPVLITGWGTTSEDSNSLSSSLQGVVVEIVDLDVCRAIYGSSTITDRMLCAAVSEGGKDACQGDSGGPLVVDNVLVGIVSWGYGCAKPGYPGINANVSALRNYIRETTGI